MNLKQREHGLDIIRAVAIFLVVTIHSITYLNPLSNNNIHSVSWMIAAYFRYFSAASVPLFILLTGYLNKNKKVSLKYFLGIFPVVISYIVISIFTVICVNIASPGTYNFVSALRSIFDFTANGYAWYVEMYIGLFLIIPFLNTMFDALGTFKNRMLLCIILGILTLLPPAVESFRPGGRLLDIIPEYWQDAYPITYYFIGAMIAEYKPKVKKIFSIPCIFLVAAIPAGLCALYSSADTGYAWYMMNGFGCITTGAIAVAIFIGLYDLEPPKFLSVIFREFSLCSFEMYLFSYVFDKWLYSRANYSMPLMILTVFALSYAAARIMRIFFVPIYNQIKSRRYEEKRPKADLSA